jgi:hypothetical protein
MVYLLARITQVIPVYKFGEIFFFLIELDFVIVYLIIIKYNSFRKKKPLYIKLKHVGKLL